ncbi:MAG: formate/nitrite transporter family protein [Pseudomonadota bacterium]
MTRPQFDTNEDAKIADQAKLRADHVYEVLRREGEEELSRPIGSLAWAGLAAGLAIGFSVVGEAALAKRLPDAPWAGLIADMGYTIGFILVILGRLQLFTEHTITAVMPICYAPSRRNFICLARLWSVVLATNMLGATAFAAFMTLTGALPQETVDEILSLGRHVTGDPFLITVAKGVGAGFLIAMLVWILPNAGGSQIAAIFLITYVIAMAGFAHVIAGTVEVVALVLAGGIEPGAAFFGFILPALIGNIIGGTGLFAMLAYTQVRAELDDHTGTDSER